MGFLLLALLAADPHAALVVPERLSSLDEKGAKVARDIAREDRVYRVLDPEVAKLKAKTDAGGPDPALAEWDAQKAVLGQLHAEFDTAMTEVRALKASKTGATVDAARAVGDKLDGLAKRVLELRDRVERLAQTVRAAR
jgi:hypothetical protein